MDDRRNALGLSTEFAFVLHLGAKSDPRRGELHGRIEHVVSGSAAHFTSLDELLAFLAGVAGEPRGRAAAAAVGATSGEGEASPRPGASRAHLAPAVERHAADGAPKVRPARRGAPHR